MAETKHDCIQDPDSYCLISGVGHALNHTLCFSFCLCVFFCKKQIVLKQISTSKSIINPYHCHLINPVVPADTFPFLSFEPQRCHPLPPHVNSMWLRSM